MSTLTQESSLPIRAFLVGCSRSGTTVVQRCLSGHPGLTSFPETDFLGKLVGGWSGRFQARFDHVRTGRRRRAFSRLAEVLSRPELVDEGEVHRGFRESVSRLIAILDELASERNVDGWIEKTPKHFRYLGLMETAVADLQFIHLVRDGRDVVTSLVNRAQRHARFSNRLDPLAAARLWNEAVRTTARYLGCPRHLVISYENFVTAPEIELRRVCEFLGLQYDPRMLQESETEGIVRPDERWKSGVGAPVAPQRSKFSQLLTETDQRRVVRALDWRSYHRIFPRGVGRERD